MRKHTLIILGGNSFGNKHWIREINKYLKSDYSTVEFYYSHWKENSQDINFEEELKKLSKFIKDNSIKNYSIVAKSAGFVLSLQGVTKNILTPKTIVGYGLPIEYSNYRKIDLRFLVSTASMATSIICVQADDDPQGNLIHTEDLVSDMIPIVSIKDNTHNYYKFKQMANIAKAFVSTHQAHVEHKIEKIDSRSLSGAIKYVNQFPEKFRFKNNWIFDIENRFSIFAYKNKKYILKQGNINKIKKETENASKVNHLIDKIKIGKKELIAVVPNVYKINSRKGYLVSEYLGPDCNELFYQHVSGALSTNEVVGIIKKLNKLSILHKDFLPRNTIVKNNKIYLIDWENVILNKGSVNKTLQYKTSILVGWRNVSHLIENKIESIYPPQTEIQQDTEYLNEYEETFKKLLGLISMDSYQIRKLCYENVIKATSYENGFSLIKIDDILHSLSEILPIEIELLIDFLLCEEYERESNYLYSKLSNIIKIARVKSFMYVNKNEIKLFIYDQVKNLILQKLRKEYGNLKVKESLGLIIQNKYPESKPANSFLTKVQILLNS